MLYRNFHLRRITNLHHQQQSYNYFVNVRYDFVKFSQFLTIHSSKEQILLVPNFSNSTLVSSSFSSCFYCTKKRLPAVIAVRNSQK